MPAATLPPKERDAELTRKYYILFFGINQSFFYKKAKIL